MTCVQERTPSRARMPRGAGGEAMKGQSGRRFEPDDDRLGGRRVADLSCGVEWYQDVRLWEVRGGTPARRGVADGPEALGAPLAVGPHADDVDQVTVAETLCAQVAGVDEDDAAPALYAAVAVVEPVYGGVELVVRADCLQQ